MFERVLEVLEVSRILNGFHNSNPQLVNSHINRNYMWERNMWKLIHVFFLHKICKILLLRSKPWEVEPSQSINHQLSDNFFRNLFTFLKECLDEISQLMLSFCANISRVLIHWWYSSNARLGTTTTSMTHYWLLPEVRWCVSDHFLWPLFFATALAHLTRWPCTNQISLRKNIKFPSNQILSKSNVWWWLVVYEKQLSH